MAPKGITPSAVCTSPITAIVALIYFPSSVNSFTLTDLPLRMWIMSHIGQTFGRQTNTQAADSEGADRLAPGTLDGLPQLSELTHRSPSECPPITSFTGVGIQQTGGTIQVGRDVIINASSASLKSLTTLCFPYIHALTGNRRA